MLGRYSPCANTSETRVRVGRGGSVYVSSPYDDDLQVVLDAVDLALSKMSHFHTAETSWKFTHIKLLMLHGLLLEVRRLKQTK